jgi:hypothetical protein
VNADSIWFFTGFRGYRLKLSGELLEIFQQLTCRVRREDQPPNDDAPYIRRAPSNIFFDSLSGEGYDNIALYETNASDLANKDFSFVEGVFKGIWVGHRTPPG